MIRIKLTPTLEHKILSFKRTPGGFQDAMFQLQCSIKDGWLIVREETWDTCMKHLAYAKGGWQQPLQELKRIHEGGESQEEMF